MSRVTSKLQVTIPKALAKIHGIGPGAEVIFESAGEVIRLRQLKQKPVSEEDAVAWRLRLFDEDTAGQRQREGRYPDQGLNPADRGWRREDLYRRGLPR